MSKGWVAKTDEEREAEASAPKAIISELTPEAKRAAATRKRQVQALVMQRERVLSERTSSPHRRSALEMALATIEQELEQLGWSIKV
jgi:hypothetical protein